MLEEKTYSFQEMCTILKSKSKKSIDGKLKRYDVEFESAGRGEKVTYKIKKIRNPFKLFCIIELDFLGQTNFVALLQFLYHFFCDEYFMMMPDEVKEYMMNDFEYHISRQTITNYEKHLYKKGFIAKSNDCYYYFADRHTQKFTDRKKYLEAWHDYWFLRNVYGEDSRSAMFWVKQKYGGAPMKQYKIELNAFTLKKVNTLINLIGDSIENKLDDEENLLK